MEGIHEGKDWRKEDSEIEGKKEREKETIHTLF